MRSFGSDLTASAQDETGKVHVPAIQDDSRKGSAIAQSTMGEKHSKGSPNPQKALRGTLIATWIVRLCFAFVFVVNVQCALGFALAPEAYMGAYELTGAAGRVATQGIGIAFLMWNCTYPLVIWQPQRHRALAGVVLAQQAVGLVGESVIRATLPAGHDLLASSIDLFITFDAAGLLLMGTSWTVFLHLRRAMR